MNPSNFELHDFALDIGFKNITKWIEDVVADYDNRGNSEGAIEACKFNCEFLRRGKTDDDFLALLKSFDDCICNGGLDEDGKTASKFLKRYLTSVSQDANHTVNKPKHGYVGRIVTLRHLTRLANMHVRQQLSVGLSDKVAPMERDEIDIWNQISEVSGALELSKQFAKLKILVHSLGPFIWLTNLDSSLHLDRGKLLPDRLLRRILHGIGKIQDKEPREDEKYVCLKIPTKCVPKLIQPAIWHGDSLVWRPYSDCETGWGRAVDFKNNNFAPGCLEAVHVPIYWEKTFIPIPLGPLSKGLRIMDHKDWEDYFIRCMENDLFT